MTLLQILVQSRIAEGRWYDPRINWGWGLRGGDRLH